MLVSVASSWPGDVPWRRGASHSQHARAVCGMDTCAMHAHVLPFWFFLSRITAELLGGLSPDAARD